MVDQLIIMSLHRYLKSSADSGGTHSNLGLLTDPNVESGKSARAVMAAAKNEVVAFLSVLSHVTNHEIGSHIHTCTSKEIVILNIR